MKQIREGAEVIKNRVHKLSNEMSPTAPLRVLWWTPDMHDSTWPSENYRLNISSSMEPNRNNTVYIELSREEIEDYPGGVGMEITDKALVNMLYELTAI